MQFHKAKWLASMALIVVVLNAWAEEDKEEAKGEGAKKETALPKDQKEFNEKTSRLNSLATRIEEAEKQFNEIVRKKAEEKNADEKQRLIKQMVEATKDRNKAAEEYNKLKSELGLRYPNQGEHINRRYQTQSKKSVEELEGAAGLDELLTRTKKIVERKFKPFADEEEAKHPHKVQVAAPEGETPQPLRLEK